MNKQIVSVNVKNAFAAVDRLMASAVKTPFEMPQRRLDPQDAVRQVFPMASIQDVLAVYSQCKTHALGRNTVGRLRAPTKSAHVCRQGPVPATQRLIQFVFFQGELEVLDGAMRLSVWADELENSSAPSNADVIIHYPQTEDEYKTLYRTIDSMEARKTSQDTLYGIMKYAGVACTSQLFQSNKLTMPLAFLGGFRSNITQERLLQAAQDNAHLLRLLDGCRFKSAPRVSYSGGVWLGLLTLFRDEPAADVQRFAQYLRTAREHADPIPLPKSVEGFLQAYQMIRAPGVSYDLTDVAYQIRTAYLVYKRENKPARNRKNSAANSAQKSRRA